MIWAAFYQHGKTNVIVIEGRQSSEKYIETLQANLLGLMSRFPRDALLFQHDNCSIHASKATRKWLNDQNIKCMDWPSRSPDLNPMENLWSVLTQKVYANSRQFKTRDHLIETMKSCWANIETETIDALV